MNNEVFSHQLLETREMHDSSLQLRVRAKPYQDSIHLLPYLSTFAQIPQILGKG